MNWRSKTGMALVTLALIVAVLASCAPAAAPGEEVTIAVAGIMTGAIATVGIPLTYGGLDYLQWVNEHGGIDGTELNIIWEETAGLVPRAITAHKRFVRAGAVAEIYLGSSQAEAMATFAPRDEVPTIHESALTEPMYTDSEPWIFATLPGWPHYAGLMLQYAKEHWTESRAPRVGTIIYDYGSGWAWGEGVKKYAPELGFEFVGFEVIPMLGAVDTSVEWLRVIGEEPDWILPYATGASLTVLLKDSARLEIQKKGIKLGTCDPLDESVVPYVVGDDADGWYVARLTPFSFETPPAMKDLLYMAKKVRGYGPERVGSMYIATWINAQIAVEGIRLAIEEVGLENLDGRAVRDGLTRISNFDTGLVAPMNYHTESPYFQEDARICQIRGDKFEIITDWIKFPYYFEWY